MTSSVARLPGALRAALLLAVLLPADLPARLTPPGAELSLRVVSYNIRHGRGTDERVSLERTAAVLRSMQADVVALQEVDDGVERSGRIDQAARLGAALGMHHSFASFFDYQGGRYGMAILSRRPIRRSEAVRLSDGNEPRVALAVEVEQSDGTVLTIVNVHFDWVHADSFRYTQAQEVARYLDALTGPYVLVGDFNDRPDSRTIELFRQRAREAVKPADSRYTFPATEPEREIDFIFVAPATAWVIDSVAVVNEPLASDHRPVLAGMRYVARSGDGQTALFGQDDVEQTEDMLVCPARVGEAGLPDAQTLDGIQTSIPRAVGPPDADDARAHAAAHLEPLARVGGGRPRQREPVR
jgi:endonuclease/exonuclease/phosphatase family metal-dependent hydrolase